MERRVPTLQETAAYLKDHSNWGRWGPDEDLGAMNLITPEKVVAAATLVKRGRRMSLSRFLPKQPGPGNPVPAQHWMRARNMGEGGAATDFYGTQYHGLTTTHLDALCHLWGDQGLYNGKDPKVELTFDGATFGSVDKWADGIITRGVLLDIPRARGEPYVGQDSPIHGWELEDAAKAQGVSVEPGDALLVYCGREAWQEANPDVPFAGSIKPGLHASCIPYIRETDVCMVVWDMQDAGPVYDAPFPLGSVPVHCVIYAFGVAILDNALLQPLAEALAQEGRYDFMLTVAPLKVEGGTGSPVNPVALF